MNRRHRRQFLGLLILCTFWIAAPTLSQGPPASTAPATAPVADVAELSGTISGVEGIVQVREHDQAPWQPARVEMAIGAGAEFRTGPRSAVRIAIPPDQTITLDRLGTMKLIDAVRQAGAIKTDLGMKYGRVRYDIEAAGEMYDAKIHSPGSTLAVRGTRVSLYNQPPYAPRATSLTGVATLRTARKQMVAFGGKSKAAVEGDSISPAHTALVQSTLRSAEIQYTEQQLRELAFLFSHQGAVFGNVAAGRIPVTDAQLPGLLGGHLDFVLRWIDPAGNAADLNLVVSTPRGEVFGNPPFILSLFPNNPKIGRLLAENFPQSSPSGGQIGLNHIGPAGIEIASFGSKFPRGTYVVAAYNFIRFEKPIDTSTFPRVPFTIEAFVDGKRQRLVVNLQEVLEKNARPRFGLVYRDTIALTELKATALQVRDPRPSRAGK